MELLKREAGIDILHSRYKGSSQAQTELMGGCIDLVADPFLSVIPFVKANRMKMIATMGERRVAGFDYPTIGESLPGFKVGALHGLVAAAGTPQPVLQKIQRNTAKVLRLPEMKQRFDEYGMELVASTPDQFDAFRQRLRPARHRPETRLQARRPPR